MRLRFAVSLRTAVRVRRRLLAYAGPVSTAQTTPQPAHDADLEELVGDWTTFPEIAERFEVPVTRVHNLVKDRRLLAARIGERAVRAVPALFLTETGPLETLQGTAVVLQDAGFSEEEAIRWLFTADDSLPGRPVDGLRDGRKTEIRRRAQSAAW